MSDYFWERCVFLGNYLKGSLRYVPYFRMSIVHILFGQKLEWTMEKDGVLNFMGTGGFPTWCELNFMIDN